MATTPLESHAGSPMRRNRTKNSSIGTQESIHKPKSRSPSRKKNKEQPPREKDNRKTTVPVMSDQKTKSSKKQKGNGIVLNEPRIFFDEEKVKFKLLANFLNCYKEKL